MILTNRLWACNPHRPPIDVRPNPNFFRGAMFNFLEVQARRVLSEHEVRERHQAPRVPLHALHAKSDQELYAVLLDGTVKQSTDGGATWTDRVTPPA